MVLVTAMLRCSSGDAMLRGTMRKARLWAADRPPDRGRVCPRPRVQVLKVKSCASQFSREYASCAKCTEYGPGRRVQSRPWAPPSRGKMGKMVPGEC